jgi:hypothetical protein
MGGEWCSPGPRRLQSFLRGNTALEREVMANTRVEKHCRKGIAYEKQKKKQGGKKGVHEKRNQLKTTFWAVDSSRTGNLKNMRSTRTWCKNEPHHNKSNEMYLSLSELPANPHPRLRTRAPICCVTARTKVRLYSQRITFFAQITTSVDAR